MITATKKDLKLWESIVASVKRGDKGGNKDQWSARKAQIAVRIYKEKGGEYIGDKNNNNSLTLWTQQNWTTKSGKPSLKTGERYLPKKAIKSLSEKEYEDTSKAKKTSIKKGEQFSKQPKNVSKKVSKFT